MVAAGKGGRDMKRIAIFCDGTWNRSDADFPTNVVLLSQAARLRDDAGTVQQVIYQPGVGTGRGATGVARWLDRTAGGAFGLGLNLNLEEAYRALVFAYEPGDEIYLFGFSRGAFTARSLAGFVRTVGLPPRAHVARIPKALDRYRSRMPSTHPAHERSFEFRLDYAPGVVTSREEAEWRAVKGHPPGHLLEIAYMGVWDTVGSLGVPAHLSFLASVFNGPHRFHDAALSRSVRSARHAVAVDERRRTFEPTLWDNLASLNGEDTGAARRYRQEWFPGTHGSVGGGGDITGLSDAAAVWIAEGAMAQGLAFDAGSIEAMRARIDPRAPLRNRREPQGSTERLLSVTARDRAGPAEPGDVSEVTRSRWRDDPGYRPKPLAKLRAMLDGG
jgi:uncharacterized protein (DUF2235 family)